MTEGDHVMNELTLNGLVELVKSRPKAPDEVVIRVHPESMEHLYRSIPGLRQTDSASGMRAGVPVHGSYYVPIGKAVMINMSQIDRSLETGDMEWAVVVIDLKQEGYGI